MNKKYTAEELDLLHAELYDILGETIRVCQKHNIPYFVIGGTAIGALYDQAILPWDDDIDIGMTRENYNKFLKVAPGELGPSYIAAPKVPLNTGSSPNVSSTRDQRGSRVRSSTGP